MLVDGIHAHARIMTRLVNNVVTIAGLDSGTLTFDIEPIDLVDALQRVIESARRAAAAKGLAFEADLPADLPDVLADPVHLPQALAQLLDNAVRYTTSGAVRLSAVRHGNVVRIDVSDAGPGIAPEQRQTLFTRFARGAEGLNSSERGMGLGLAIASELIQRQGARCGLIIHRLKEARLA